MIEINRVKFIAIQENMSRNIFIRRCRIRWETMKLKCVNR